jgi:thiosulfate/3-mercaptopyruvate sulfurtransferase
MTSAPLDFRAQQEGVMPHRADAAFPEKLVSTEWVAAHLNDPGVRIVESNEDVLLYSRGHVPGAVHIDWVADLNDPVRRDYLDRSQFETLMSRHGIGRDTRVVFYGDKGNWWACYALWVFELFGHTSSAIMDGGRTKWEMEKRPWSRETPSYAATNYVSPERADYKIRAFRDDVLMHIQGGRPLIDVRSPGEYSGELFHMDGYPQEGSLRTGHIRGAVNVPWAQAVNAADGTFKSVAELRVLYEGQQGLSAGDDVIVYCRIGERSSHTWFALRYILGYSSVRNYDGSWTEWGNLVGVPIER